LEKNPYLIKNSVNVQPRWDINPISNLKWSGSESTKNLARLMMELCNTQTMATISHGDGMIEPLIRSLENYSEGYPKNLIVFHTDGNDYEFTTHSFNNS
jgi:hypothetical protein